METQEKRFQPRFTVDQDTHHKMRVLAAAEGKDMADIYADAVKEKIEREKDRLAVIIRK